MPNLQLMPRPSAPRRIGFGDDASVTFNADAVIKGIDPATKKKLGQEADAFLAAKSDSDRNKAFLLSMVTIMSAAAPPLAPFFAAIATLALQDLPKSNGQITWEGSIGSYSPPVQSGSFEDTVMDVLHRVWLAQDDAMQKGQPYNHQDALVQAFAATVLMWNNTHLGPRRWIERTDLHKWGPTDPIKYVFQQMTAPPPPCPQGWTCPPSATRDSSIEGKNTMGVWINDGARIDPRYNQRPPIDVGGEAPSTTMSTGAKVAIGTAAVAGTAAAGLGIWAFVTHQAYTAVLKKAWSETGGRALRGTKKLLKR
jgi:hypothetical protein